MNTPIVLTTAVMIAAGGLLATQVPINAALARALRDPLLAACVSFGVGFLALTIVVLAKNGLGSLRLATPAPAWVWLGGVLGAGYVACAIWGVPKLGVLTTVSAVVLGQLLTALALDALGAFGLPVQGISPTRVLAVALVAAGVVLSQQG